MDAHKVQETILASWDAGAGASLCAVEGMQSHIPMSAGAAMRPVTSPASTSCSTRT